MGIDALFMPLRLKLSSQTQKSIKELILPVLEVLRQRDIPKVTVSFSPIDIKDFKTKVDSDSVKQDRIVTEAIELKDVEYPATVYLTQVTHETSQIPVVVLQFDDHCQRLVNQIFREIEPSLPMDLEICPDPMSLYLIGSQDKTGPLWKVHRDNCELRLHIVISECEESFVWYEDGSGATEIGKFRFQSHQAVILSVREYHTVEIESYFEGRPRIHLVADLRTKNVT